MMPHTVPPNKRPMLRLLNRSLFPESLILLPAFQSLSDNRLCSSGEISRTTRSTV